MRTVTAFLYDVRFQWRHRFYHAYMLVCALYLVLLHFIPEGYRDSVTTALTFSDPSALGLLFAGGILLLEKDQGVHDSLFVTPFRLKEYLLAKAASLAVLSLAAAWTIHLFSSGLPASPVLFSLGVLLTSSLFTFLSIGVVVRCRSINGFILMSQVYAAAFTVPLLGFFGVWETEWYRLLPTEGSLMLLKSAFQPVSLGGTLYAVMILSVWNALIFVWAERSFAQKVLMRIGDGGEGR